MIKRASTRIIEPLGFVREDEDRWVATFKGDYTGTVYTVVTDNVSDDSGVPMVVFRFCDELGNLVNTMTLDQLLVGIDDCLKLIEPKSNKSYEVIYNVTIQVPVYMDEVSDEAYRDMIIDGCDNETEVAEACARRILDDKFEHFPLNVLGYDCREVSEL